MQPHISPARPAIVLVHGGFVDGPAWQAVYRKLRARRYTLLDHAKFAASFAADADPATAAFLAESQVPWGVDALNGTRLAGGVANKAELVSGRDGRLHDSAARAAPDGEADGRHGQRR